MSHKLPDRFTFFDADIDHIEVPDQFTFPFYYDPHELCKLAAKELQEKYLINHQYQHNFGLKDSEQGMIIGKMFGVLIVRSQQGTLGYLSAYSGKLAESNHHEGFVPPVYDMLTPDSYFKSEEEELNEYNRQIETLEHSAEYQGLKQNLADITSNGKAAISTTKLKIKEEKKQRKSIRESQRSLLTDHEYDILINQLKQQSIKSSYYLKDEIAHWKSKSEEAKQQLDEYDQAIKTLKEKRRKRSNELQSYLFKQYSFLNARKERQDLLDIFDKQLGLTPPAGSGECAAPKLLQYAYTHSLMPIAMAEFWWGQPPKSQVRKHGAFYPACRSKCEPILSHMLLGLDVQNNPIIQDNSQHLKIDIIYQDDHIVVINKPPELLSVPGKTLKDSVWIRMKSRYPHATGPIIVHRLDMSTSGIMILALDKDSHKYLQHQFIKRTAKKTYIAVLDGLLNDDSGVIQLPLRVDLDNRPQQLVCYEHGKPATTHWEKVSSADNKTVVHFYPQSGRTHQLRVHAAHPEGLNTPIIGDDLYGTKGQRLYLHAQQLSIRHPKTKEWVNFTIEPNWRT